MGGTSMSAPLVAGCAALVREYYQDMEHDPIAALLKATLINATVKLTGKHSLISHLDVPNGDQGFGGLNMSYALPNRSQKMALQFFDNWKDSATQFNMTGEQRRFSIALKNSGWLRLCLCYTDPPARALQNNLNLIVDKSGTARKWLGNSTAKFPYSMLDAFNNVEVVNILQAEKGVYTVAVTASNLLQGSQDFALVVTSNDVKFTMTPI